MKQQPPALLSILRSNLQGRLLARLLLEPDREFGVRELAEAIDGSLSSVHSEIERLAASELIRSRVVGRSRLITANTDHELYASLYDLFLRTYGPRELAEQAVRGRADVEEAYIFGSWARRYMGEPGPAPRDLDVVLIGPVERAATRAIADGLEAALGREVGVIAFSAEQWDAESSGFLQTLKRGPLVPLVRGGRR